MMLGFVTKIFPTFERVREAADRAVYTNIRHAAFSIRKTIRESIKKSPQASAPGEPVATRGKRGNVKNAYFAAIEPDNAIIGPRYSMVADSMHYHEFGGRRKEDVFQPRPTAAPGLEANTDRFAGSFRGSIGE